MEIFEKWLNRKPKIEEIELIKTHFKSLLEAHIDEITEITDALAFIQLLSKDPDFELGFATGGWKETAELKCSAIDLDLNKFIFKSSSDHFNRAEIIKLVIKEIQKIASSNSRNSDFEKISKGLIMFPFFSGIPFSDLPLMKFRIMVS